MPLDGNKDFIKLNDLYEGSYFNCYGVILAQIKPKITKGKKYWHIFIQLNDMTNEYPVVLHIYLLDPAVPTWLKQFSVVRVRNAKVEKTIGNKAVDIRVWAKEQKENEPNVFPVTVIWGDGQIFGENDELQLLDKNIIQELFEWSEPWWLAAQPQPQIPISAKVSSNQVLICNIRVRHSTQQWDLVCQVMESRSLDNGRFELIVTDGTRDDFTTIEFYIPPASIKRLQNFTYIILNQVDVEVNFSDTPPLKLSGSKETKPVRIANEHDAAKFIRRQRWRIDYQKMGLPIKEIEKHQPYFNLETSNIHPEIKFSPAKTEKRIRIFKGKRPMGPVEPKIIVPFITEEPTHIPKNYVAPMSHQIGQRKVHTKKMWITKVTGPEDYPNPKGIVRIYCLECSMVFPYSAALEICSNDCPCCEKKNQKGKLTYMFLLQFEMVDTRGFSRKALFPTLEGDEEFGCSAVEFHSERYKAKQNDMLNTLDLLVHHGNCCNNRGLRTFHMAKYKEHLIVRTVKCRLLNEFT